MTEVENTYGLITADDMDTIELKEIKTTDLTEVHGLGTGLKGLYLLFRADLGP